MHSQQRRVAKIFDRHSNTYGSDVNAVVQFSGIKGDFFTRVKIDYLFQILSSRFLSTDTLSGLDIGCGIGAYHNMLAPKLGMLSAVDVSERSIGVAYDSRNGVDYAVYDGLRLPYRDEQFDFAFAICVVHHVPEDQWGEFFREMRRVIKQNGLAVIFEHNPWNPLTRMVVNSCPFDEEAVLLTAKTASRLMRDASLKSIEERYILLLPAYNRLLRKIDWSMGRAPIGTQYVVYGIR